MAHVSRGLTVRALRGREGSWTRLILGRYVESSWEVCERRVGRETHDVTMTAMLSQYSIPLPATAAISWERTL